ncbi:hypothetical protein NQ317_008063 [Molorchus minor]|uniref:Transglutaminase-like domain-containing protein n=1 Tax=Molorchus minor TaxID=1323400 RepID=A0ABQ9JHY6_9CUCU|nr:hypothetical protein NQ317_008063 [Molorchus minor]
MSPSLKNCTPFTRTEQSKGYTTKKAFSNGVKKVKISQRKGQFRLVAMCKKSSLTIRHLFFLKLSSNFAYKRYQMPLCKISSIEYVQGVQGKLKKHRKRNQTSHNSRQINLHRCKTCHQFTSFPRYNDLNILLETPRGRCGLMGKYVYTFLSSIGWDARFVVDEGDHVWTEVYSVTQKRWLHTVILVKMYAIHHYCMRVDEIQDVTWRYTSNHKEVLKRRKNCSEEELISALFKLRSLRQKNFQMLERNILPTDYYMNL